MKGCEKPTRQLHTNIKAEVIEEIRSDWNLWSVEAGSLLRLRRLELRAPDQVKRWLWWWWRSSPTEVLMQA